MSAKALVNWYSQEGQVLRYADMAFMGGLFLLILTLPTSEALKNAGHFLALGGWLAKRAAGPGFRVTFTPIGVFLSLYLLTSLLSAAFAIDQWEGLRGAWDVFRPLSLFLMVLNDVDTDPKIRFCLWLFVVSTGMGVAWGLADYFSRAALRLEIKSLGHPNHTATYLVIMLALLLSLLLIMDWPLQAKVALGVLTAATLLALLLTYSRGGWMGLLACVLFLSISLRRWKPILLVALLAVVILVSLQATGRLWTGRVEGLAHLARDGAVLERFRVWRGSVLSLQERPLLGVGPRNFKYLDNERYGFIPTNHAHNLFFTATAERGLLGVLSLLALFACYVRQGIKRRRNLNDALDRVLWHAAMGSFITIVVAGMANTTLQSEGSIALWFLTALMLARAGAAKHSPESVT